MAAVVPKNPRKAVLIGWVASWCIRLVSLTLRYEFQDPHSVCRIPSSQRLIWIFWHNRIFLMPIVYRRWLRHRLVSVLTSASRDGAAIAQTVGRFGVGSVRGSSSKRGAQALTELASHLKSGRDIVITPDGPRGPCYKLAPGPVKLAQLTGVQIVSANLNYSRAWKLKSWDQFRIPKPFSRVLVEIGEPQRIDSGADVEEARTRVEQYLMQGVKD